MLTRDYLIESIDSFLKAASSPGTKERVTTTSFGVKVVSNPNLIPRLRAGGDVTTLTYDRCIDYMERWYQRNGYYDEEEPTS
jgi:hypothetical protein|tara:strand:+ start:1586 stop:1831 length:246 start_codon:yes stop_codon:yes gene_type:complete